MSGSATLTPPGGGATPSPGGAASAPGGAPASPGGAAGGPPIGSSSATGPSQNLGATAQGNQIVSAILQLMAAAMTKVPPGSEQAKALSEAHYRLGKTVEPGAASPAGVSNAMKNAMMQRQRMAPQMGAMATQAGAPGGAGAAPPKPPGMAM